MSGNHSNCCHGDDVPSEMCGGKVDAIWDINSIVAMPMDTWDRYITTLHCCNNLVTPLLRYVDTCISLLKPKKRILLSTIVYNEAERGRKISMTDYVLLVLSDIVAEPRTPYSVPTEKVKKLYGKVIVTVFPCLLFQVEVTFVI